MRAHFVPVSYLKAFSSDPAIGRKARIRAVERSGEYVTSVDNVCVCSDYYSHMPSADAALFRSQEISLPQLANTDFVPPNLAHLLWELKLRNRAILDFSRYREMLLMAAKHVDLGERITWYAEVEGSADRLVTCDDPVIVYSGGVLSEYCFLLAVSPTRLAVSAPRHLYRRNGVTLTSGDVRLINTLLSQQTRRTVLLPPAATVPRYIRDVIPHLAKEARSELMHGPSPFVILNFHGPNPHAAGQLPSCLGLAGAA